MNRLKFAFVPLLLAVGLAVSGCGIVPKAAPYDATAEKTVSEFDKAFQSHVVTLYQNFGTPSGKWAAHKDFYAKWHGELAHLVNRAVANDPADKCPLVGQTAEALASITQASGAAAGALIGPLGSVAEVANQSVASVKTRIGEIESKLNQSAGDLTPQQVVTLKRELDQWKSKLASLEDLANAAKTHKVEPPEGGCSTLVMAKLAQQFKSFELVHESLDPIGGLSPRARAPLILMNVAIQSVMKVQAVKRAKAGAGLL